LTADDAGEGEPARTGLSIAWGGNSAGVACFISANACVCESGGTGFSTPEWQLTGSRGFVLAMRVRANLQAGFFRDPRRQIGWGHRYRQRRRWRSESDRGFSIFGRAFDGRPPALSPAQRLVEARQELE